MHKSREPNRVVYVTAIWKPKTPLSVHMMVEPCFLWIVIIFNWSAHMRSYWICLTFVQRRNHLSTQQREKQRAQVNFVWLSLSRFSCFSSSSVFIEARLPVAIQSKSDEIFSINLFVAENNWNGKVSSVRAHAHSTNARTCRSMPLRSMPNDKQGQWSKSKSLYT